MRTIYFIVIALSLLLCGCTTSETQTGLIGWEITFGVKVTGEAVTPGLTFEKIDSICDVIAAENEYEKLGVNHVILHKMKEGKEVKQKAIDFAKAVDGRIKDIWGEDVKVDSRYTKLQVVFDADFDATTETVAIYKYK